MLTVSPDPVLNIGLCQTYDPELRHSLRIDVKEGQQCQGFDNVELFGTIGLGHCNGMPTGLDTRKLIYASPKRLRRAS